jgi:ribonucleotide monophosphatase NagD (HAD superfamily)
MPTKSNSRGQCRGFGEFLQRQSAVLWGYWGVVFNGNKITTTLEAVLLLLHEERKELFFATQSRDNALITNTVK